MGYINGEEIMFSANVNITEIAGGGVKKYAAEETYNKGDIVAFAGFLYTPKQDNTKGVSPSVNQYWYRIATTDDVEHQTADYEHKFVAKQNNNKTYPRAYVDFGYDATTGDHIGDGFLICSEGNDTKGILETQYRNLPRFTNRGTLRSNDPITDFEVVNKRTLESATAELEKKISSSGGSYWDFIRFADGFCEGETPIKVHLDGVDCGVAQILVVYDHNGYINAGGAYIYGSNSNEGMNADWYIDNKWGYCAAASIEGNADEKTVDIYIPHSDDGSCSHTVFIKVLSGSISDVRAEYNIEQ